MGLGGIAVMHTALIEDSYITFGYARALRERFEWGILPGHPANTATSPLNVMLLAALSLVSGDPLRAVWVVAVVNPVVTTAGLLRLGRCTGCGRWVAGLGLPLLFLDPLLVSTLGLESLLAIDASVWLLVLALEGRPLAFGLVGGLAVLLRADMVVVMVVLLAVLPGARRPWRRALPRVAGAVAAVAAPWFVFSWIVLGSAVPDTLALKTAGIRRLPYWNGLWARFAPLYPAAVWPAVAVAAVGLVAGVLGAALLARHRDPAWRAVAALVASGVGYWAAYVLLGVSSFFWYYALPVGALTLALTVVLARLAVAPGRRRRVRLALATALAAAAVAPLSSYWIGVVAAGRLPLGEAPVYANWASTAQYRRIGQYLGHRFAGSTVGIRSAGEFGEMQYYCRCLLVDRFDSRDLLEPLLSAERNSSWAMRLNYLFHRPEESPEVPIDYRLVYTKTRPPTRPLWRVSSPTRGRGWYALVPVAPTTP